MADKITEKPRCSWCGSDPLYVAYHDTEWGMPVYDDQKLFEFLVLETFQAGLSWITVLRKRENFRRAFDNFDPVKIADYGSQKVASLLADEGIIRNRLKVSATISNAQAFLAIQQEHGSFSTFLWDFVGGKPIHNAYHQLSEVPAHTTQSSAMSKALKQKGFKFVGTTVIYAFMQATGMVNDHVLDCYRYAELNPNA